MYLEKEVVDAATHHHHHQQAVLFSTDVVLARDVNSEKWQVGTVNFPPVTTPGSFAPPTVQTAPTSAPRAYGQVERVVCLPTLRCSSLATPMFPPLPIFDQRLIHTHCFLPLFI